MEYNEGYQGFPMRRVIILHLVVSGILAAIAVMMPNLIILGLFLFFLPGLILMAAPTAFFYGALFAATWFSVRPIFGNSVASFSGAAVLTAVALGVPVAMNATLDREIADRRRGDLDGPALVSGSLRIERYAFGSDGYACDELCAAALFTPGITAVTVADLIGDARNPPLRTPVSQATYRLGPRVAGTDCPNPKLPTRYSEVIWPDEDLRAGWTLALSAGACLLRDDARVESTSADWTLRSKPERSLASQRSSAWDLRPKTLTRRVVLLNHSGEIVRRTGIVGTMLHDVLWISPDGIQLETWFAWGRRRFADSVYEPIDVLKRSTNLVLTDPTRATVREQLYTALDDPALAPDAAVGLVQPFLQYFDRYAPRLDFDRDRDVELLGRIIADPRVRSFNGIDTAIRSLDPRSATLRGLMVSRVLASRVPVDREPAIAIGEAIRDLPAGLFATATPDEMLLLADDQRRRWASGLVFRQSDRGAAAGPLLVDIIAQAYARPVLTENNGDPDRLADAAAAVQALCVLGPTAKQMLQTVDGLIEAAVVPRRVLDEKAWELMLARLGKPVSNIAKPASHTGTQDDFEAQLMNSLARFSAKDCR